MGVSLEQLGRLKFISFYAMLCSHWFHISHPTAILIFVIMVWVSIMSVTTSVNKPLLSVGPVLATLLVLLFLS